MDKYYFDLHIGESSWDRQCLELFKINVNKSILHNDYFNESSNNARLLKLIKIFFAVLFAFISNKKIIFTSINSESMIVQTLFAFYKKSFFLIPNVCGFKMEKHFGAKLYRYLITTLKERVLVTDEVTFHCLKSYGAQPLGNIFELTKKTELPFSFIPNYIVVLPTPDTHSDLLDLVDKFYNFHFQAFNYLYRNQKNVYLVIHPRDRGYTTKELEKRKIPGSCIISNEKIKKLENIVYVSGISSLCLNKRYSGKHGIWISMNKENVLKDEFKNCEKFLIDIKELA